MDYLRNMGAAIYLLIRLVLAAVFLAVWISVPDSLVGAALFAAVLILPNVVAAAIY